MPQNIYDNDRFFAGYSTLPRSVDGLSGAPEWPAVEALLPNLAGVRILDLGCGFGAFDRWSVAQGAEQVLAVDLSRNMLARARALTTSTAIEYRRGDLAQLASMGLPAASFELIYSGLAFHYIQDFAGLCVAMRSVLTPGGRLVATVEHPLFSAPTVDQWRRDADRSTWPLERYLDEGERVRNWFADGVIKYHRSIATYVNCLLDHSFRLERLIEWGPSDEQIAQHPDWSRERDRPPFLIIAAEAIDSQS